MKKIRKDIQKNFSPKKSVGNTRHNNFFRGSLRLALQSTARNNKFKNPNSFVLSQVNEFGFYFCPILFWYTMFLLSDSMSSSEMSPATCLERVNYAQSP